MSSTSDERRSPFSGLVSIEATPAPDRRQPSLFDVSRVDPDRPAADVAWLTAFRRTTKGNYAGEFYFEDKKTAALAIKVLLTVFKTDRSPHVGLTWTWSLQVLDGPQRLVMERPQYSNLYFVAPADAAFDVRGDLGAAGFVLGQPRHSSVASLLGAERKRIEREETGVVVPTRRVRYVNLE